MSLAIRRITGASAGTVASCDLLPLASVIVMLRVLIYSLLGDVMGGCGTGSW